MQKQPNLLIDLYKTKDLFAGLGQFSLQFAQALIEEVPQRYKVDFLMPPEHPPLPGHPNIRIRSTDILRRHIPQLHPTYDLWHSLHQFPSFLPGSVHKWVLTIHDLNFMIEKSPSKREKYRRRLQHHIQKADAITTISKYSKQQILSTFQLDEERIHVIYNGVKQSDVIAEKPSFVTGDPFFFSIGIFSAKKNFVHLLPLMRYFPEHQLVIAGNHETAYGQMVIRKIKELDLQNRVCLSGKISEAHKKWLYQHGEALLFPSSAEGFGLPVIEAMQEGMPTFLSPDTALPEIGGSQAFYFTDLQPASMAQTIKEGLEHISTSHEDFREASRIYAERFNWGVSMQQYLKLYDKLLK